MLFGVQNLRFLGNTYDFQSYLMVTKRVTVCNTCKEKKAYDSTQNYSCTILFCFTAVNVSLFTAQKKVKNGILLLLKNSFIFPKKILSRKPIQL